MTRAVTALALLACDLGQVTIIAPGTVTQRAVCHGKAVTGRRPSERRGA
jgi:hypothetical protein